MTTKPKAPKPVYRPMTKCRNAKRYTGQEPPRCGCDWCSMKYLIESRYRSLLDRVWRLEGNES